MPAPSSLVLPLGTASVPKTFTSLQNVGLLWSKMKMITRLTLVTWCETHRVMPSRLNNKAYESVIDCWSYSLVPLLTAHLGILLLLFPFFCGNPSVSHGTSLPLENPFFYTPFCFMSRKESGLGSFPSGCDRDSAFLPLLR